MWIKTLRTPWWCVSYVITQKPSRKVCTIRTVNIGPDTRRIKGLKSIVQNERRRIPRWYAVSIKLQGGEHMRSSEQSSKETPYYSTSNWPLRGCSVKIGCFLGTELLVHWFSTWGLCSPFGGARDCRGSVELLVNIIIRPTTHPKG